MRGMSGRAIDRYCVSLKANTHLDMLVGTSVSLCPEFLLDLTLNNFSKITTTHMFACHTKVLPLRETEFQGIKERCM